MGAYSAGKWDTNTNTNINSNSNTNTNKNKNKNKKKNNNNVFARYQASAEEWIRTALLWDIAQRVVVIRYRIFGTTCRYHPQGAVSKGR
jgi:hypothetical protein